MGGYGIGDEYGSRWGIEHNHNTMYENLELLKKIKKQKEVLKVSNWTLKI